MFQDSSAWYCPFYCCQCHGESKCLSGGIKRWFEEKLLSKSASRYNLHPCMRDKRNQSYPMINWSETTHWTLKIRSLPKTTDTSKTFYTTFSFQAIQDKEPASSDIIVISIQWVHSQCVITLKQSVTHAIEHSPFIKLMCLCTTYGTNTRSYYISYNGIASD